MTVDSEVLLSCVAFLGLGVASAFLPFVNAEAAAVGAVLRTSDRWLALVLLLAVGQSLGKILVFMGTRRGSARISRWTAAKASGTQPTRGDVSRIRRLWRSVCELMVASVERPVIGPMVIFASALVGIPPLLVVAVVAGASRASLPRFAVAVVMGRCGRFGLVALPVAAALHG